MTHGFGTRYVCGDEERRATLRRRLESGRTTLNGIDFLDVIDLDAENRGPVVEKYRQRVLLVQCFANAPLDLDVEQAGISGGERVRGIHALWVGRLDQVTADPGDAPPVVPGELWTFLHGYRDELPDERTLVIVTSDRGDYERYVLSFVRHVATDPRPRDDFDPRLSQVSFTFKAECPSSFDCRDDTICPPQMFDEPVIDYQVKDYGGFRRLMLDRLSATVPEWRERHPADTGVMLVELLASVADQLSYFQDAAATEAYLDTARRRLSVRRHARLVDYFVDEGANARTWVFFQAAADAGGGADGFVVPGPRHGATASQRRPGTRLLGRRPDLPPVVDRKQAEEAMARGAVVFETLLDVTLRKAHDKIPLYAWSDRDCCLPRGSTSATLGKELPHLAPGDFLLFEEVVGPKTGSPTDADPSHRHVVRLTAVEAGTDPLLGTKITEVRWHADDALPFPLCLSATTSDGRYLPEVSVARGNVVLADQGRTLDETSLGAVPPGSTGMRFRPRLPKGLLIHAVPLPEEIVSAAQVSGADTGGGNGSGSAGRATEPAIRLRGGARLWQPRRDLLASGPFSEHFVAEMDADGNATLRFGDGVHGLEPSPGTELHAVYRVGARGSTGNVGAGALAHVVLEPDPGIAAVRNPAPARGGRRPESLEQVRRLAPHGFRRQERAVTADDYARTAERHVEVQRAAATFRWTGSWMTAFVTVDRRGGCEVDAAFEREMVGFLDRFRLAGYDVEIDGPRYVSLDLKLRVCVTPDREPSAVYRDLMTVLGSGETAHGRRGLFHADDWTFNQTVYLSPIYAAASAVDGVDSVVVERFQRWNRPTAGEIDDGFLPIGRLEIARLDNDPSRPENGRLEIELGGGR